MFERLEVSTRAADVRGVLLVAASYSAVVALPYEPDPRGMLTPSLMVAVFVAAAGTFARRGGSRWIWPTARHSMLAAGTGIAWIRAEEWAQGRIYRLLNPDPLEMRFSIVESGCFDPAPVDVALMYFYLVLVVGLCAVPVGWVARRLIPAAEEW